MAMHGGERGREDRVKMEESRRNVVYMCGYLPGASPEKSPMLSPTPVRDPGGDSWKDVFGGGCGFAMAVSDDEGQSYITSGKHGDTPEPFPLPTQASVLNAAAGWAHCVTVTEPGETYTWGWKECVPSSKLISDSAFVGSFQKEALTRQSSLLSEQVSPKSQPSSPNSGMFSQLNDRKVVEETVKRRKVSSAKQENESVTLGEETFTPSPCLVTLGPGVRITTVAAGGRHSLALSGYMKYEAMEDFLCKARHLIHHIFTEVSDVGQVWGWGYGGEGQLGLGTKIKMMSSPHLIPCIQTPNLVKDGALTSSQGSMSSGLQSSKVPGNYVRGIACGGRHSAVITDTGALLTFGWGLYGQCGQGSTNDQLRPTCVSSLLGTAIGGIAAGLWHTICVSTEGRVYAFGGSQFGQLGTGGESAETLPQLLECPDWKGKQVKVVSSGARHNAVLTEDGQVFSWGWNKYGQVLEIQLIATSLPKYQSMAVCQEMLRVGGGIHCCLLKFLCRSLTCPM
ncbi:ultraviolet-B receptor UVR8-like isoform X3 [Rhodamnia argentea]|uniref:Ultraviolet-B receptor UVR8-like isoform X3 n=1 Tax=Rhodamnia argentea TaxID=178133 RepID=A0ABM3HNV3_9MYRT|nr:ultraviolet-B receptor UVR8-like isoform X3 [Rhodamnia argentea]